MNLLYDLRGLQYDTLVAGLPPESLGVGCGPLAVRVGNLQNLVCPQVGEGLVGLKGGLLRQNIGGEATSFVTTNFNARIQYMFDSRLVKGQKVKRSVRCEACDITLNSELQAKQHYKGKFHQRKLRQQIQHPMVANETSSDVTQCAEKSGGLKRSADKLSDDSVGHVAKLIRTEDESERASEESSPEHGTNGCATVTTSSLTVASEECVSSSVVESGDQSDAVITKDKKYAMATEAERRSKEIKIDIRVKNSHKSTIPRLTPRPVSIPVARSGQFLPLPSPGGMPRGMVLVPHPLVTCHTIPFQSPGVPWQGGWVHRTLSQPTVQGHCLSFSADVCGSQNSTRCLTSGFAPQRAPSNIASEVNVTSSLPLPLTVMQQATPAQTAALYKSLGVKTDNQFASVSGQGLTAIALSNQTSGLARSSWQRGPDHTQLHQPIGVACSKDLDRLDPVSRAVYSNFLGHFTTGRTRNRPGRLR